jgi:hypothetical protein
MTVTLSDSINLLLANTESWEEWVKKLTYKQYSPRDDAVTRFIRANEVNNYVDDDKLPGFKKIVVKKESLVGDVIKQARLYFPSFDEDYIEANVSMFNKFELLIFRPLYTIKNSKYCYRITYHLHCPSLGRVDWHEIKPTAMIKDLELENDDVIIIEKKVHSPSAAILTGIRDYIEFHDMVWGANVPNDPMLLAALLYTDEDVGLAKYVREHFDSIHQMSGTSVVTYVIERPPINWLSSELDTAVLEAREYWKLILNKVTYRTWSLLGWTLSKPPRRSDAYKIAKRLCIYPDQLPCLTVFDRSGQSEKIVIPVDHDYSAFFRKTFSDIQRVINISAAPDISNPWRRNKVRSELFNKLQKEFSEVQRASDSKRTVYNFYGQTVFINHPAGIVKLQNFGKNMASIPFPENGSFRKLGKRFVSLLRKNRGVDI